ncbi:MAG: ATP-binding protein [Thermodesulfobacteriota bacterium]
MGLYRYFSVFRGIAAILFSLALVVYLGFLLYSQYRSQSELYERNLGQMLHDIEKSSLAVGYFYAERQDDMARLAESRELLVYFENLALGMSMQYGLSASIMEVERVFHSFIQSRKLADSRIFSRIVFLDAAGSALVDVPDNAGNRTGEQGGESWQRFMTRERTERAVFFAEGYGREGMIILSLPYWFKGVYSGQLVAMLRPALVYEHFLAESASAGTRPVPALVYDKRYLFAPDLLPHDRLPAPAGLSTKKGTGFRLPGKEGPSLFNAYLTPITDTPFALAAFIPASDDWHENSPQTMMLITAGIGIIILGGAFVIFRTSMKNAVLKASREQIIRMNRELEQRVTERTADLEASNRKLEKAYAELKAAQSQMLHQEKMASIGQLAAGVAHEINNPIGFMLSNLGTLGKYAERILEFGRNQSELTAALARGDVTEPHLLIDKLAELRKKMKIDLISEDIFSLIEESKDGGERVKKIVQNLKSFARLDEVEHQETDINEGLDRTINIVWNELKYKAELHRQYGDIPKIRCCGGQLNQVFMNMLVNAGQAIDGNGEITVCTWHDGGMVYIAIADTGSGMPPEVANRIFEPFYTTKEVGKGTGLGLSISYDIIKKHNGTISVASEVGKGSTFTIAIPVV